jgi:hypothetical protein
LPERAALLAFARPGNLRSASMKKLGTSALVVLAAVAVSSLSLGCEKKEAPKPANKPAPTGGTTGGGTGGGAEKPAGGGH